MSSLCGGVVSQSQSKKNIKKYGAFADAMAYVMPDEQYEHYVALHKLGETKKATKLFEKYARSSIG